MEGLLDRALFDADLALEMAGGDAEIRAHTIACTARFLADQGESLTRSDELLRDHDHWAAVAHRGSSLTSQAGMERMRAFFAALESALDDCDDASVASLADQAADLIDATLAAAGADAGAHGGRRGD